MIIKRKRFLLNSLLIHFGNGFFNVVKYDIYHFENPNYPLVLG
ncbi:MAG: hypothetical protein ACI9SG_002303 [Maribacter sp.]|jgi:hypothetical protein